MSEHIIVVSHRRSGTHLTIDSITNNFKLYSKNPDVSKITMEHLTSRVDRYKHIELEQFQENTGSNPCVIKTHAHADLSAYFGDSDQLAGYAKELFSRSRVIYVYRDGRDVLTSLYFYMQSYDPSLKEINLGEFIRMENSFDKNTYQGVLSRVGYWNFHVNSWINASDVLFLSFDELLNRYEETIKKIARFIDQPVSHNKPRDLRIVRMDKGLIGRFVKTTQDALIPYRLQKRLRRRFQKLKRSSVSFREGKSQDWRNYFSEDDLQYFNSQTEELRQRLSLGI